MIQMQTGIDDRHQQHPYSTDALFRTVVAGDYCIGCGACASLLDSPIRMELDAYGRFVPRVRDAGPDATPNGRDAGLVCPFYPTGTDETELASELFPQARVDDHVGRFRSIYAGYVADGDGGFRDNGSSGGMSSWILASLLEGGHIDGVIHVRGSTSPLFEYGVSSSFDDVTAAAKSRYFPIEMSGAMTFVRENPGRYAFVGVPCFVKAARLLARADPMMARSLRYFVALVCGHLKTAAFAEMLAWQLGVPPEDLTDFDFRVELEDQPASHYAVRATMGTGESARSVEAPSHSIFGTNWGLGMFKPNACDYCDDVAGELADITLGDAWLPEYVSDSRGTNIVIVRNRLLGDLIEHGVAQGELVMDPLTPDRVYASQAGNFRHRREGLAYRLWRKETRGEWHPPKRVQPSLDHLSRRRRAIYDLRTALAKASHVRFLEAKQAGSLDHFVTAMEPLVRRYDRLYRPIWRRILAPIVRVSRSWLRSWR